MLVKAIRDGYYNHRRVYKGETFSLFKQQDFSKAWMEQADGQTAQASKPVAKPKVELPPVLDESESDSVI